MNCLECAQLLGRVISPLC